MTRIGENIFQFSYSIRNLMAVVFLLSVILLWYIVSMKGILDILFLPILSVPYVCFILVVRRYIKSGVILDKEKGTIILHKWTWNIKKAQKFEEIPINEIMGIDRDIDVTTTTRLSGNTWQTTESRTHNIVLQGKFGTRRFALANQDDWNLFMTLLYGEEK